MGTNFDTIQPMHYVKRWSSVEKRKVFIQQPNLIADYNNGMGGVDLHDQCVNAYKIKIRGKKWWWPLFTSMLSSTLVNAWKLYKVAADSEDDLLSFQRDIARYYLRRYTILQPSTSKRSISASVALSEGHHFPKRIEKPLRCRVCHMRVRWVCEFCDIVMCVEKECFKKFHVQN